MNRKEMYKFYMAEKHLFRAQMNNIAVFVGFGIGLFSGLGLISILSDPVAQKSIETHLVNPVTIYARSLSNYPPITWINEFNKTEIGKALADASSSLQR